MGEDQNPIGKRMDEEVVISEEVENDQANQELSKWFKYHRQYSKEEKRLLIAKVVLVALEVTLSNHIYQCQNVLYR